MVPTSVCNKTGKACDEQTPRCRSCARHNIERHYNTSTATNARKRPSSELSDALFRDLTAVGSPTKTTESDSGSWKMARTSRLTHRRSPRSGSLTKAIMPVFEINPTTRVLKVLNCLDPKAANAKARAAPPDRVTNGFASSTGGRKAQSKDDVENMIETLLGTKREKELPVMERKVHVEIGAQADVTVAEVPRKSQRQLQVEKFLLPGENMKW